MPSNLPCRSHRIYWTLSLSLLVLVILASFSHAGTLKPLPPVRTSISAVQVDPALQIAGTNSTAEPFSPEEPLRTIADPFEPLNRMFFHVNDKLHFWVLKPVASGYKTVVALPFRLRVRDFFSNAATPVRIANCLLQFKIKGAGTETLRFVLNTTVGVVGFYDIAKKGFKIDTREEDFGQTLGFYGIGPVFYINWPLFGPSSLRDTFGTIGNFFLDPWTYLFEYPVVVDLAIGAYERVNDTSLTLGEYEDLKEAALDPYIALRDAYHQIRQKKIEE
ncbi:MAG: VacJ family lipoprotein [Proteobacteria bacterium]|nr:VacJ family lipoprotein [Pseudomonadota bacterium]